MRLITHGNVRCNHNNDAEPGQAMTDGDESNCVPHFFDPAEDYTVVERRLPHWVQPGAITFITFRTCDSMPKDVVQRWRAERREWLRLHAIDPDDARWRDKLRRTNPEIQDEFRQRFAEMWHAQLDRCHGLCVLQQAELAQIVASSLMRFDGDRYEMLDYVIMPNHVHLLAAFIHQHDVVAQTESWKRFTATQINRRLQGKGRFWQTESFDHLVRSETQFRWLRRYIEQNPANAGLSLGPQYRYSKPI